MSNIRMITAHDEARYYGEMAVVGKEYAARQGYSLEITKTTNVKHSKAALLKSALTENWVLWIDADCIMLDTIDELIKPDCDYDVAFPIKEPVFKNGEIHKSGTYGSYLYSGFVLVHNTERGRRFLTDWNNCPQIQESDQLNIHDMFEGYLDDSIFDRIGETIDVNGLKVHLLDPDVFSSTVDIHCMQPPRKHVKVLHFKGALHKRWPTYYKEFLTARFRVDTKAIAIAIEATPGWAEMKKEHDTGKRRGPNKYFGTHSWLEKALQKWEALDKAGLVKPSLKVLDIGAGFGHFVIVGEAYTGSNHMELADTADPLYDMVTSLLGLSKHEVDVSAFIPIQLQGGHYDLITSYRIVFDKSWEEKRWRFFLHDMHSLLNDGGSVVLGFNNKREREFMKWAAPLGARHISKHDILCPYKMLINLC